MSQRDPSAYFNFALPATGTADSAFVLHPRKARGAVASLILGLVALPLVQAFIGFPLAIAGIICGISGLLAVRKGDGRITGKALAIAGLAFSIVALVGGAWWVSYSSTHQPVDTRPQPPFPAPARPPAKPAPKPRLENP
ncbi:MAG: DUF4190 domain-containing protein [Luteolibacter sp.]